MKKIAFQGHPGAYSHAACLAAFPGMMPLPCNSFAEAFQAVEAGKAELAMIPIDNSIAGRVADIHHLLPRSKLFIVGEYFLPVHHCLLGVKGAKVKDIKTVYSHTHALPQCRKLIAKLKLKPVAYEDTAGAARKVAQMKDKSACAIASAQAAKLYGLSILKKNIEDEKGNVTRFIALSRQPAAKKSKSNITSILFDVKNLPAALHKALGCFAAHGVNLAKIESYIPGGKSKAASFYCELEAHADDAALKKALSALKAFSAKTRLLGSYAAASYRYKK